MAIGMVMTVVVVITVVVVVAACFFIMTSVHNMVMAVIFSVDMAVMRMMIRRKIRLRRLGVENHRQCQTGKSARLSRFHLKMKRFGNEGMERFLHRAQIGPQSRQRA